MANQALIIAVEKYADQKIQPVRYAEGDARDIATSLHAIGFETTVLLSGNATKATIESAVRRVAGTVGEDDAVYFFFAGHGFAKNDVNYLTCRDTRRGDLVRTSVELRSAVFDVLRGSKSRRVALFLDACESGMGADPNMRGIVSALNEEELEEFFGSSEFYVCFASCKPDESSFSSPLLSHGIWTYHLIEALSGRAKLALEKGFVTSSSLQDYLSKEVPLTVKTSHAVPEVQTPWACGAMSRQFIVADLRQVLAAEKQKKLAAAKQVTQALLRGTTSIDVKRLSGFRKGHHVPDGVNSATEAFVQRIGYDDLKEHFDQVYDDLKTYMGYKRRQLKLGEDGIETPDFEYSVSVGLDPDDPSTAVWHHMVAKMGSVDVIFSDGFERVFGDVVDTAEYEFAMEFDVEDFIDFVEDLDSEEIRVRYKRGGPECDVHIRGFDGVLHLSPHGVQVTKPGHATPRQLLESVASAQKLLVSKNYPALPIGTR